MSLEPDLPDSLPEPSVGDLLTADAAGAQATDPRAHHGPEGGRHGRHGPFHTHCENCGAELRGPWCHACGQHDFEFHRSFRHVFMEALEAFLHFDSNFFRSMAALLVRPGWLTEQFNAGKRAAQMPPFRLYLFVAFVFFLAMHFLGGGHAGADAAGEGDGSFLVVNGAGPLSDSPAERRVWSELTRHFPAEAWHDRARVRELYAKARRVAASVAAGLERASADGRQLSEEETLRLIEAAIAADVGAPAEGGDASAGASAAAEGAAPADAAAAGSAEEDPLPDWAANLVSRLSNEEQRHLMVEKFVASIPKVLLICMPVFALLTRALFRRSREVVYLKHLVLALHFHTFVYLWILVVGGLSWVAALPGWGLDGWVQLAGVGWIAVYIPWMLHRLFGNGWAKTLAKSTLLGAAYGFTIALAFATAATVILVF